MGRAFFKIKLIANMRDKRFWKQSEHNPPTLRLASTFGRALEGRILVSSPDAYGKVSGFLEIPSDFRNFVPELRLVPQYTLKFFYFKSKKRRTFAPRIICKPLLSDTVVDTLSYKTISANKQTVVQKWHIIDAENQIVGRLATTVANLIRGKHKASFTPHVNTGDKVIVINAEKVRFTGKKMDDKIYLHYTGYPGGQRATTPARLLAKKPDEVLRKAVEGMLPGNKLDKEFMKNLFIYAGTEHPHGAQNPKPFELKK